jgi:hypothetical protein
MYDVLSTVHLDNEAEDRLIWKDKIRKILR